MKHGIIYRKSTRQWARDDLYKAQMQILIRKIYG